LDQNVEFTTEGAADTEKTKGRQDNGISRINWIPKISPPLRGEDYGEEWL